MAEKSRILGPIACTSVAMVAMLHPGQANAQQFDPFAQQARQTQAAQQTQGGGIPVDACVGVGALGVLVLGGGALAMKRRGSHVERQHGRDADNANDWYRPDGSPREREKGRH